MKINRHDVYEAVKNNALVWWSVVAFSVFTGYDPFDSSWWIFGGPLMILDIWRDW